MITNTLQVSIQVARDKQVINGVHHWSRAAVTCLFISAKKFTCQVKLWRRWKVGSNQTIIQQSREVVEVAYDVEPHTSVEDNNSECHHC